MSSHVLQGVAEHSGGAAVVLVVGENALAAGFVAGVRPLMAPVNGRGAGGVGVLPVEA